MTKKKHSAGGRMKRVAGVAIILAMIGVAVLIPYLFIGDSVWPYVGALAVIGVAICVWLGVFWLASWLWDNVSEVLGWILMGLNLIVFPSVGMDLVGGEWWGWFVVLGMALGILLVVLVISVVGGFALKLIKGEK